MAHGIRTISQKSHSFGVRIQKFRKMVPTNPSNPRNTTKTQRGIPQHRKTPFSSVSEFRSKTSESITGWIPRGHRHTHWLAMRYPIRQGRNIIGVDASGLPPGMIVTQEPMSGYHHRKIVHQLKLHSWRILWSHGKWGLLPPIHSSPLVRSSNRQEATLSQNVFCDPVLVFAWVQGI